MRWVLDGGGGRGSHATRAQKRHARQGGRRRRALFCPMPGSADGRSWRVHRPTTDRPTRLRPSEALVRKTAARRTVMKRATEPTPSPPAACFLLSVWEGVQIRYRLCLLQAQLQTRLCARLTTSQPPLCPQQLCNGCAPLGCHTALDRVLGSLCAARIACCRPSTGASVGGVS